MSVDQNSDRTVGSARNDVALRSRVAAHRIHVPGLSENSLKGLLALCRLEVPYLEIDSRVTKDGQLVIVHDANFRADDGVYVNVTRTVASSLQQVSLRGQPIATLDTILEAFREHSHPVTRICIDIKDFGYEQQHLELIRKHQLEDRSIVVSWIPQALLRFSELGYSGQLVLSQWNLLGFGVVGELIAGAIRSLRLPWGSALLVGRNRVGNTPTSQATHLEPKLITGTLPADLERVLRRSGGAICVRRSLYGKGLARYAERSGLALWLYTAANTEQFMEMAKLPNVTVVLCRDAAAVLRRLA